MGSIWGEEIMWAAVLLLALYGTAQLIRRIVLWMTRPPRTVAVRRVAVPDDAQAVEPLLRCLQAQAAWGGEDVIVVLPPAWQTEEVRRALADAPDVTAVQPDGLLHLLLPDRPETERTQEG